MGLTTAMKLRDLKENFKRSISKLYPPEEVESFFNILSEKYLGLSRIEIALHRENEVSREQAEKFKNALARLRDCEPVQYIVGETQFFELSFKVNEHTLIPRPETEELVDWILSGTTANALIDVLDIGTGSGCIAIALAKNLPNAKISALDISGEALKIARKNAKINEVEIDFFQTDILRAKTLDKKYDVIVSNPPYVREVEKDLMSRNVVAHEPFSALFVSDEDPLLFYRVISNLSKEYLRPGGKIFFEINEYLAEELTALLRHLGFYDILVQKDIFGKDRMIRACARDA